MWGLRWPARGEPNPKCQAEKFPVRQLMELLPRPGPGGAPVSFFSSRANSHLPPPWMPGGGRAERGQGVEPAERAPLQVPPSQGARSALLAMPLWDGQCSVAPGRSAHVPPAPLGTYSLSSPSVQLRQSPSPSPASRPEQTTSPGGKEVGVQGASSQLLLPSRTLPLLVPALRAEPVTPPPPFPGLD